VLPLAVPETVRSIRKGTGIDQCGAGADRVAAGELPVRAAVDGAVAEIDKIGADARQCVRGRAVRDEFQRIGAAAAIDRAPDVGACWWIEFQEVVVGGKADRVAAGAGDRTGIDDGIRVTAEPDAGAAGEGAGVGDGGGAVDSPSTTVPGDRSRVVDGKDGVGALKAEARSGAEDFVCIRDGAGGGCDWHAEDAPDRPVVG